MMRLHIVARRAVCLTLLLLPGTLSMASDSLLVTNVRFRASGEHVTIAYDLMAHEGTRSSSGTGLFGGTPSNEYKITLVLQRDRDSLFRYYPRAVTGHVGEGIAAGRDREIRWLVSREFPRGLEGDDFYFMVLAEPMMGSSANARWWWIGIGTAVLGGTVAAILLSGGGNPPPNQPTFPEPPGRP